MHISISSYTWIKSLKLEFTLENILKERKKGGVWQQRDSKFKPFNMSSIAHRFLFILFEMPTEKGKDSGRDKIL